jgi:single-stranded DNA-binding protein
MMKAIITGAVISKGFDGAPALRFNDNGGPVQFKIGKSVYDKNAENKKRYINIVVKAFGAVRERIEKMELKEGSYINIVGRLDEDVWDGDDGEKKRRFVIIIDEIEYSGGNGTGTSPKNEQPAVPPANTNSQNTQATQPEMPPSFAGYQHFQDDGDDDLPF